MISSNQNPIDDFRLLSSFEEVRTTLSDERFADRRQKPLAFWALPNDRRLPIAFLGRSVEQLLSTPFEELSATPGIGQKKIQTLVELLHRATADAPVNTLSSDETSVTHRHNGNGSAIQNGEFDSTVVSESLWAQWRDAISQFDLGCEKLGRLTSTLQSLPTVIWNTPMSFYLNLDLAEIRALKTHGEKRVCAVLKVFYEVNNILSKLDSQSTLAIRFAPKLIASVETWIGDVMAVSTPPSADEIRKNLATPLAEQIRIDAGSTVHQLVEGRLGIHSPPQSVRAQSRQMGVTRARVYQLFEDCTKIMSVRWPEGKLQLAKLADKLIGTQSHDDNSNLLDSIRGLFFAEKLETDEDHVAA